jgi:hypothetical protein
MGPGTKDEVITPPSRRELMTRKANPVLSGGVVCGTWTAKNDELVVRWLDDARVPRKALAAEVERLGGILGAELRLTVEA